MKRLALYLLACAAAWAQTAGPSFEVAIVKASPPNNGGFVRGCKGGPGTGDPALWRCTNATILMLILRAYDLQQYQVTLPDWMTNANYEISARLAPDTTKAQFRQMIQNLLADRFKLEFHRTRKEMAMYDLVVFKGGPKLIESSDKPPAETKDDPPARGPQTDADGYPIIAKGCNGCMAINGAGKARYFSSKTPITDFAQMIGNQLGKPVNDKTALTGKYDITLSWNSDGGISRRTGPEADSEPGLTIERAVQEQLGLKLEPKKGMVDMIVVDKAEKNPVEN